jgi:glycerol uptake facilitator-like aquaporin
LIETVSARRGRRDSRTRDSDHGHHSIPTPGSTAFAVDAYIIAAYWFTSSTSFVNPAVTIARTLSDSFAGISPSSVPWFVLAQVVGGAIGYLLSQILYANPRLPDPRAQPEETTGVSSEQQASSGSAT